LLQVNLKKGQRRKHKVTPVQSEVMTYSIFAQTEGEQFVGFYTVMTDIAPDANPIREGSGLVSKR